MTREKEEVISHKMHAKDWKLNTSKTAEAVILLDLVATLRMKSRKTNQGKGDVYMNNKETWIRTKTSARVVNHFDQDLAAKLKAMTKLIKEVNLDMTLMREQGHREARQKFKKILARN